MLRALRQEETPQPAGRPAAKRSFLGGARAPGDGHPGTATQSQHLRSPEPRAGPPLLPPPQVPCDCPRSRPLPSGFLQEPPALGTVAGGPSSRGGTRGGTRAGGIREGKGERGGRRTGPCSAQRPTRPLAPLPRRRSDSPVPFPRRPTTPAGAPLPPQAAPFRGPRPPLVPCRTPADADRPKHPPAKTRDGGAAGPYPKARLPGRPVVPSASRLSL